MGRIHKKGENITNAESRAEISAELNLKAAKSLLEEILESKAITNLFDAKGNADARWDESFWDGFRASMAVGKDEATIDRKIDQIVDLASKAKSADPDLTIPDEEGGVNYVYTPDHIISDAYFRRSAMYIGLHRYREAQKWAEKSLDILPNSNPQLLLGDILALQGNRQDAISAYKRVIDMYPESKEAVEATKALANLEQLKPRKWQTALLLSIELLRNNSYIWVSLFL